MIPSSRVGKYLERLLLQYVNSPLGKGSWKGAKTLCVAARFRIKEATR
jgi:hypothetical protein